MLTARGWPKARVPLAKQPLQLHSPEGLAVDYDGSLLVVESGIGCLSRINISTGQVTSVANGLELGAVASPGMPSTWAFNGVAVGPSRADKC
jgi:hypothetical protein